ncbi:MAG: M48 family metallopeptidase, partial [Pseudomonadota bacterium]
LQEILYKIGGERISQANMHVRVNIYSSTRINAFATHPDEFPVHRNFLGFAEDGKPIFEIGVLQGMLQTLESEDELAFVLGHELGHILLGHLDEGSGTTHDRFDRWASSQSNEIEADLFGMKLLEGLYDLEAGYTILERLLQGMEKEVPSYELAMAAHHHPSTRLAIVLADINRRRRESVAAQPRPLTSLPREILLIRRSPRNGVNSLNADAYKSEFLNWFQNFILAPRSQPAWFTGEHIFSSAHNPEELRGRYQKDVTNTLFIESLEVVRQSELGPNDKIQRVFELMAIYKSVLYTQSDNPSISRVAVSYLGARELEALDTVLRELSFGTDWQPYEVVEIFSQNVVMQGRGYDNLSATGAIYELLTFKKFATLFERYASVSQRWRALRNPSFEITPDAKPEEVLAVLKMALRTDLSEAAEQDIANQLGRYAIDASSLESDELNALLDIFSIQRRERESCENHQLLCQAISDWTGNHEASAIEVLKARYYQLISQDLRPLSDAERSRLAYDMTHLFDNSGFGWGLSAKDFTSDEVSRIEQWLRHAESVPQGERFGHHLGDTKERLEQVLARFVVEAEEIDIESFLAHLVRPGRLGIDPDDFLKRLDDDQLFALILNRPGSILEDQRALELIAQITDLPKDQIQQIGLGRELLSVGLESGRSSEALSELMDENGALKAAVRSLKDRTSSQLKAYTRLMESETLSSLLRDQISAEDLRALLQWKASKEQEYMFLDLMEHPHMIGSDWSRRISSGVSAHAEKTLELILKMQDQELSFELWSDIYSSFVDGEEYKPELSPLEVRLSLSEHATEQMSQLSPEERDYHILQPEIVRLLPVEIASRYLVGYFMRSYQDQSLEQQRLAYEDLRRSLSLPTELPDLDALFKRDIAESLSLQPGQLAQFFTEESQLNLLGGWVRAISGLVAEVQKQSLEDQIDIIDYIAGRRDQPPDVISDMSADLQQRVGKSAQLESLV